VIGHLMTHRATVHRPSTVTDEVGGQTVTYAVVASGVRVKVGQPSAEERLQGDQWGARLTHVGHTFVTANIGRGDELVVTPALPDVPARGRLRVLAVSTDSHGTYRRLELEAYQPEGGA
jgi:hypothetical protein